MRFVIGPVPRSRTFDPVAAGWTPLSNENSRSFAAAVILLLCPLLLTATAIFLQAAPAFRTIFRTHLWSLPCFLFLLLALIPMHEFIHALAYGCGLRSPNLIAGVWLKRGLPYVLYDTPLPRRRVLWMLAAPFCALSVLPLLAAPFLSGAGLVLLCFFSALHAALCAGDAVTFLRLCRQATPGALIHNDGWQTYWATPPAAVAS